MAWLSRVRAELCTSELRVWPDHVQEEESKGNEMACIVNTYADDAPASFGTLPDCLPRTKVVRARNAFLKVASEGGCSRNHSDRKDPNLQHSKQVLQPESGGDKEPVKDGGGLTTGREKPDW